MNGTYSGFDGEFLTSLMQSINFSIVSIIPVKSPGIFDESKSKWSGAIGLLQRGEVDLIINPMIMTNERNDYVEATVPVISIRTHLFIKDPEFTSDVKWLSYFQVIIFSF